MRIRGRFGAMVIIIGVLGAGAGITLSARGSDSAQPKQRLNGCISWTLRQRCPARPTILRSYGTAKRFE
jgi:hypothetical protein